MFAYKKIWLGILTLIIISATFAISRAVTSVFDVGYWYAVGSIMLAELQCGLIVIACLNSDLRTIPVFGGNFVVAVLYLIFTLVMMMINVSATSLFVTHLVAIVLVLILQILLCLSGNSISGNAKAQDAALLGKKNFVVKLEEFKLKQRAWLAEEPALAKKIAALIDDARFAPESVTGAEDIDLQANLKLDALCNSPDPAAASACADEIKAIFEFRKEKIKILR